MQGVGGRRGWRRRKEGKGKQIVTEGRRQEKEVEVKSKDGRRQEKEERERRRTEEVRGEM